jgi:ABC-type transport system substrate-binding protein
MRTKWLLIALPLAILFVLFQSSLWVPTYASQARGNPGRLLTFVRATVGDVKQLNPVVSSDYTGRQFFFENIFEGLVTADENLKPAPKLAQRWETTEEAYVAVLPTRKLTDGQPASAQLLLERITAAWRSGQLGSEGRSVTAIALAPAEHRTATETILRKNAKGKDEPTDVEIEIDVPERVKLSLTRVEPRIFRGLAELLGESYFAPVTDESRFRLKQPELRDAVRSKFPELLPVGEHNPIITFYLQPGVKWHDGVPFTATDVKFTYQAYVDPRNSSPLAGTFEPVKQLEIVDDLTVRVTYKRLHSTAIIDWIEGLVPEHACNDAALARESARLKLSDSERKKLSLRTTAFNRSPIGTGPFRFVEWRAGQYIHVTRFDQYWGRKAEYQDFFFRTIPSYLTMELEFGAGAVDMYDAQPHQAERYRHDDHYQVLSNNDGMYMYIGYNLRREPFNDLRVRRALGMAIDVDGIIRSVLSGEGKRSTGPYYSNTPYYDPSVPPLPYDPKAALELLKQAGYTRNARGMLERGGKPLAFTLVTNSGNPQRKAIITIAEEAWRRLGVDIQVRDFEWTVFLEDFAQTNNFDALVLGWGGGAINPDIHAIWHSSQTDPYEHNHVGYVNPKADELIMEIRATYDEAERIELTHRLHRLIAEDQPYTFLYEPLKPYAFDKRIRDLVLDEHGKKRPQPLRTPASGDVFYSFRNWRKMAELVR